jgi:hypothetical protein
MKKRQIFLSFIFFQLQSTLLSLLLLTSSPLTPADYAILWEFL